MSRKRLLLQCISVETDLDVGLIQINISIMFTSAPAPGNIENMEWLCVYRGLLRVSFP